MTPTKFPALTFSLNTQLTWAFIERMEYNPTYRGYSTSDILENELYDFTY